MSINEDEVQVTDDVADVESEIEVHDEASEEEKDTTDWKAEAEALAGRLKRAETKLEKSKINEKVEQKLKEKTGELDETQLDYLDLKGVSDSDEIDVIQKVMQKTGMTVRQALKDDYVVSRLESLRGARAVKDATPSSTKRGGAASNTDVAAAVAEYEQSGKLPADFELRSAVVNKLESKSSVAVPSWRR